MSNKQQDTTRYHICVFVYNTDIFQVKNESRGQNQKQPWDELGKDYKATTINILRELKKDIVLRRTWEMSSDPWKIFKESNAKFKN